MPTIKAFKKNGKGKTKKNKIKFLFFNKYINKLINLNGGKATVYGSVGCIFSPAISCKNKELLNREKELYVSKLMLPEEAKKEMIIVNEIKNILSTLNEKFKKYLPILSTYMCDEPNITPTDLENVKICENVKGFENIKRYDIEMFRHFKMLNMINTGEDLFEYKSKQIIKTKGETKNMLEKMINFIIECIFIINNYGIFHADIKVENITYNNKKNCLSLIDFGRAIISKDNQSISPDIKYISMDFNILPQIIFFHQDFPTIYSEIKMREIIKTKIDNSINGDIMLNEFSSILSVKKTDVVKILSIALYKNYLHKNLQLPENMIRYFHDIFKWNIDMWSIFIVLNNLFSGSEYSVSIKLFAKEFFEQSFTRRINQSKIESKLKLLLVQKYR